MTVYVDNAYIKWRGMKMCHMIADTEQELHAMADRIGLKRSWFQKDHSIPHYDISSSKRIQAVMNGAVSVTDKELVEIHKRNTTRYLVLEYRGYKKGHIANSDGRPSCGAYISIDGWDVSTDAPEILCKKCAKRRNRNEV